MIARPRPQPHDELEALIKEARARQLRRRLLGMAGVAIAAALGLSMYAVVTGGRVHGVTQANAGRASAPFCRSAQLSGSAGFQGATQTMLGAVTIRNTGNAGCSLPQRRPLASISWRGKALATTERRMMTGPPWPDARVLAPGTSANVFFQWWSCGGPGPRAAVRPTFELRFGHGLVVNARSSDVTPAFCAGLGGQRYLDVTRARVTR
jgi:hypothetical protein